VTTKSRIVDDILAAVEGTIVEEITELGAEELAECQEKGGNTDDLILVRFKIGDEWQAIEKLKQMPRS